MAAIAIPVATFVGRLALSIVVNVFVFISALHIVEKLKERSVRKKNEKQ